MNDSMMNDNRMVNDEHKEGIKRVMQRKGEMKKGQGGHMASKPREHAEWRRPNSASTPRKA
jgi:hypothetical protein